MQFAGNLCVALAGLIYLFPLQHLMLERSRKKDDGGGIIAGLILLTPMWLLLLVAMLCVTGSGGFAWLDLNPFLMFTLVVMATLSLAVVSFVSFAALERPRWRVRIAFGWPIYLVPVITMMLAICVLNPWAGRIVSANAAARCWAILAGFGLFVCLGYAGYLEFVFFRKRLAGILYRIRSGNRLKQDSLARIPKLNPERDFRELLGLANVFQSHEVRRQATARLRTHPRFLDALVAELNAGDADKSLGFLESAALSHPERHQLAGGAGMAIQRFTAEFRTQLKHQPAARKKAAHRWGISRIRSVVKKLDGSGVDFAAVVEGFEKVFETKPGDAD